MSNKLYEKKNYTFLYRSLAVIRDALLEFIVENLEKTYGDDWWSLSVEPAFRAEDIEKLKFQFQRRYANPEGPARPGSELHEILDLNYFTNIIEFNWKKVFAKPLNNDRTFIKYIKDIVIFRNPVAHTESGDLRDDDTLRGLDIGERLLRFFNRDASDEIAKIKNEKRSQWVYEKVLGIEVPDLTGISINKGLESLEYEIKNVNPESPDLTHLISLKNNIQMGINDLHYHQRSDEIILENNQIFEELNQLSQKYMAEDFSKICVISPLPKLTPKEVTRKTVKLDNEIKSLKKEIEKYERDRNIQNISKLKNQFTERQLEQKQQELLIKQKEYDKQRNLISAPAYFSVTRRVDTKSVPEETPFVVSVEVNNLGHEKTTVSYQEQLSPDLVILEGETGFEMEIEADASYEISYKCLCLKSGKQTISTSRLEYAEKVGHWDHFTDTSILILPGKGPALEAKRCFRYTPDGIELIVLIENTGDKSALSTTFQEVVIDKYKKPHVLSMNKNIPPKERESINCMINVSDINEIDFPKTMQIQYFDNMEREYLLLVNETYRLLENPFISTLVGRQHEIGQVEKVLKLVANLFREGYLYTEKRVFLIEGNAGIGKSRFLEEIQKIAKKKLDFCVFTEDVSTRTPVKRILRQVLGLNPFFAPEEEIWKKLTSIDLENEIINEQTGKFVQYLASDHEKIEPLEADYLIHGILPLIRNLCGENRYLLVFENAHEFTEGIEFELFKKLLKYAAETTDIALSIGLSYRPKENYPGYLLTAGVKETRCEKIILEPLTRGDLKYFIRNLVPFPVLCDELQEFVFEWSKGIPFYVIELLRQLISSEKKYVKKFENYLYPTETFDKTNFSYQGSQYLLQRAREDTGDLYIFLQFFSVVGLDLPYRLLVPLLKHYKYNSLDETQLITVLKKFEQLGFLKKSKLTSVADLEYHFEHQLIRDAIYEEVHEKVDHVFFREAIVSTIIKNRSGDDKLDNQNEGEIFPDAEEHIRQVARHLHHAGKDVQYKNRGFLLDAAQIEEVRRNFIRGLMYYEDYLNCSRNRDNYIEQCQALIGRANILRLQGNWKGANPFLEEALKVLSREKSKELKKEINYLKSKILLEQGHLYIKLNDLYQAEKKLKQARKIYEGALRFLRYYILPSEKLLLEDLIEIHLNMGDIWYQKSRKLPASIIGIYDSNRSEYLKKCNSYFNRAERIAQKYDTLFGDNAQVINVLVREGEILSTNRDDREFAVNKLEKAYSTLENEQSTGKKNDYAIERVCSYLAEIYHENPQRDKKKLARKYYKRAREIQKKINDNYGLAISNGGIGDLYIDQEEYGKAEYYLLEAFKYQKLVNDTERFWRTSFSLVKVYINLQNFENAANYWNHARTFVLEKLKGIKSEKIQEIFNTIYALAQIYKNKKFWQIALQLYLDLQVIGQNDHRMAEVITDIGKIYCELREPEKAIKFLYDGLDLTKDSVQKADIHSLLGDICSSSNSRKYKAEAEENYNECVKLFLENKLDTDALNAYDKLLKYMASEKDSLRLAPYLHALIDLMYQKRNHIDIRFLKRAEELFNRYELYKDAGEAFVHFANKLLILKNTKGRLEFYEDAQAVFKTELQMLEKAEDYFSKIGNLEDTVSGYYSLISVYFQMDMWKEIARCYRLVFDVCLKSNKPQIFLDSLGEVIKMNKKFEFKEFKEIFLSVEDFILNCEFKSDENNDDIKSDENNDDIKYPVYLGKAQFLNYLSDKATEESEIENYKMNSLKIYDELLEKCTNPEIRGVSYNDSALILEGFDREKAKERLLESVEMVKDKKALSEAVRRGNLATFHWRRNDLSSAQNEFELSFNIFYNFYVYWEERVKNQDTHPLHGNEISRLLYEKNQIASVAERYGVFLFRFNHQKSSELLHLAKKIYMEIDQQENVTRVEIHLQELSGYKAQSGSTYNKDSETIENDFYQNFFITDYEPDQYIKCSKCNYLYRADKKECPQCHERTCPHCGSHLEHGVEICDTCELYVSM